MPETPKTSKFDLFLSHASEDLAAVKGMQEWLEHLFDLKIFASSIRPGDDWKSSIDEAMRQCQVALVLATPRSIKKPWVNYEIGRLKEKRKPVFVFCWEMSRRLLGSILDGVQACSADDSFDKQREFVEALAVALKKIPHLVSLDKNPLVKPTVPPVRHFENREQAQPAIIEMIKKAQEAEAELCVASVANTMFFSGAASVVHKELRDALTRGLRARFIFLDTSSGAARRRHIYELGVVETFNQIEGCKTVAASLCEEFQGQFQMRLSQDMPCFLCLNHESVMCQPFLNTETGSGTFTWQMGAEAGKTMREHFESLWGTRWVLFDFGNVLVPFDHARVSRGLLRYLPVRKPDPRKQNEIHRFIFGSDPSEPGISRNDQLDTGDRTIDWLWTEFCHAFSAKISLDDFRKIWCSIFDEAHSESLRCLAEVRKLNVKVGICSNTNPTHWEYISRRYPEVVAAGIEHFLSFDLGKLKSDPAFFDEVIKTTTERPHEEHLLIDDLPMNILAAERCRVRGMNVRAPVRFENVRDFLVLNHWI